ncbi:hypothetical protein GCM10010869_06070 [Mesorhizobium tianshanense]|uniref:Uncharacterized protein n=1 Tax=Mesorhizobium tianshanense TaxID=39844 RepID=A0A562NMA9_9HYPH|nr:hypothetical protein IQ26_04111 [Mesorhizobium tianshanense]GLS35019.1 hypothetical protein GCM10010869_06070 [Mesorhizobium tianshanense]
MVISGRWIAPYSPTPAPFPVHVVSAGNLRENLLNAADGKRWASIPAFTRTVDRRGNVSIDMIRRQCTTTAKIELIRRKVRELAGARRSIPSSLNGSGSPWTRSCG